MVRVWEIAMATWEIVMQAMEILEPHVDTVSEDLLLRTALGSCWLLEVIVTFLLKMGEGGLVTQLIAGHFMNSKERQNAE